jgi:hypothetical protein
MPVVECSLGIAGVSHPGSPHANIECVTAVDAIKESATTLSYMGVPCPQAVFQPPR